MSDESSDWEDMEPAFCGEYCDLMVGLLYIIVPLVAIGPYIAIIWLFRTDSKLKKQASFVIMTQLGVCDLVFLSSAIVAGLSTMLQMDIPYTLSRVLATLMNLAWYTYLATVLLIAVNRVLMVSSQAQSALVNKLFNATNTKVLCAVCVLPALVYMSVSFWIGIDIYYAREEYTLGYTGDMSRGGWLMGTEESIVAFTIGPSFLCYILLFIMIKKKALLITVLASSVPILDNGLNALNMDNKWTECATFMLWVLNAAINPVIYLTLNQTIKTKMLRLMQGNKVGTTTTGNQQHVQVQPKTT